MDLIKAYLDQTDDEEEIREDQMVNENNQANNQNDSKCDKLIVEDLLKGLMLAIEQRTIENDKTNKQSRDREQDQFNQKPFTKRKNADEIVISSDESSLDESSSDESSVERRSPGDSLAEENELNSDLEENELDKCLVRLVPLKTKGEMLIEELPPPEEEEIQLTCNIDQLQQIGSVSKILDNLVIVESFENSLALDLDSVLFFRTGKSIGRVFDVIGSVKKPFYVIRFKSNEQIGKSLIFINMPVYFVLPNLCMAPFQQLNVTKFVLVSQLKSIKGTDASWLHNNEPPENVKDYSDDEEERRDQMKLKAKRKHQR